MQTRKMRNWLAVHAHFRQAGPHDSHPKSKRPRGNWRVDAWEEFEEEKAWEEELEAKLKGPVES